MTALVILALAALMQAPPSDPDRVRDNAREIFRLEREAAAGRAPPAPGNPAAAKRDGRPDAAAAPSNAFDLMSSDTLRNDAWLHDVCFTDAQQGWAVGDRGGDLAHRRRRPHLAVARLGRRLPAVVGLLHQRPDRLGRRRLCAALCALQRGRGAGDARRRPPLVSRSALVAAGAAANPLLRRPARLGRGQRLADVSRRRLRSAATAGGLGLPLGGGSAAGLDQRRFLRWANGHAGRPQRRRGHGPPRRVRPCATRLPASTCKRCRQLRLPVPPVRLAGGRRRRGPVQRRPGRALRSRRRPCRATRRP